MVRPELLFHPQRPVCVALGLRAQENCEYFVNVPQIFD
jgi:hypothetical protein